MTITQEQIDRLKLFLSCYPSDDYGQMIATVDRPHSKGGPASLDPKDVRALLSAYEAMDRAEKPEAETTDKEPIEKVIERLEASPETVSLGTGQTRLSIYPPDLSRLIATHKELVEAADGVIKSWDNNTIEQEKFVPHPDLDCAPPYWAPHQSMVNSQYIAGLRKALTSYRGEGE